MINRAAVKIAYLGLLVFVAFFAFPLYAQERPADNMQIVREAVRGQKKLLMAENMQLTESEAANFWPVYERYQDDLKKLDDRTIKLIENYAKNYLSMSDAVAQNLVEDFLTIEEDRLKLNRSYLPQFRKVLPATKVARYYQLENKFRAVVNYETAAQIPIVK